MWPVIQFAVAYLVGGLGVGYLTARLIAWKDGHLNSGDDTLITISLLLWPLVLTSYVVIMLPFYVFSLVGSRIRCFVNKRVT